LGLVPVAAIAWWLGSPLLMNTTVEEEFPFAFNATVPFVLVMGFSGPMKINGKSMDENLH